MELKVGYVYDIVKTEKRMFSNDSISKHKYVYLGKSYLGDITGFGDTVYYFVEYKNDLDFIDIKDRIEILVKCGEKPEDIIGVCTIDEYIIPYNVQFKKIVIERYELT